MITQRHASTRVIEQIDKIGEIDCIAKVGGEWGQTSA